MKYPNPTKHINFDLNIFRHVSSNVRSSKFGSTLYVVEDNEVIVKMIIKWQVPQWDTCQEPKE